MHDIEVITFVYVYDLNFEEIFHYHFISPELGANCKVEAEECDTYEEGNEEPIAMIEESPPDMEQDGQCNLTSAIKCKSFWVLEKESAYTR
jgi:hypothetical protein